MSSDPNTVSHDATDRRFHVDAGDGAQASLTYREAGPETLDLVRTYTPPSARGRGLAGRLVRAALDHARAEAKRVIPSCWYVAQWMDRNPEYDDLRS